ncbi:hypothetical protein HLK59_41475 [Streptomyces sp. S3(2020)]|uniref:hypothetical protein n=1 Tax=Streptomyces sp. S3(2020) TaxID=2732044 RepID=UPI0014890054|nr:hypothetical protein [Streptomyces sp. S3(2020)]NNN36716.1 hypothetical protein [Streptomyces sp. S3(2020)]
MTYPPYPSHPPQGFGPPPPMPMPMPEFLAVDRRSSVAIDSSGVTLELNGVEAEFDWPEIRSVHYRASPNGKSLMVAVVHVDGNVYECVLDAKPRERLREWFAGLAAVLGYYRPVG